MCLVIRTLLALAQPNLRFCMSKGRADYLGISGFPSVTFWKATNCLPSFIQWALAVYSKASRPVLSPRACALLGQLNHTCWQLKSFRCLQWRTVCQCGQYLIVSV